MKLGSFTILNQDCFPKSDVLGDLPQIVCNIIGKNIKILITKD